MNFTKSKVVVNCTADWCAACKQMEPLLEEMKSIYKDVEFIDVDAEKDVHFLNQHHVRSLPTFLFFKDGEFHSIHIGTCSPEKFKSYLDGLGD